MGEVYLADDTKLNRRVALKFLPSHLAADTTLRARFTREVQAVAALNHPNIVHVYEVSEFRNRPYFAMEYVEGEPLRERMRVSGKMSIAKALDLIIGLCEGLEAAHKVGIVHRDIKPANIVIANSERVKILDFGLAKRASDPTLTSMGSTLGTICYMSPEQVQGKESDNRSDLFSAGIVLYEMLAGRLPFRGDYDAATLTAIVSEPHESLAKFRPDAPPRLSAIVDRLLAKDPARRFQDVAVVLDELEALLDEMKFGARSVAQVPSQLKSKRPLMFAAAAAVIAMGALATLFMSGGDDPPQIANQSVESSNGASATLDDATGQSQEMEQEIQDDDAATTNPVVDRSAYVAESIATANESERLRALRDSMEKERARILAESQALAGTDTTTHTGDGRWERATTPHIEKPQPVAVTQQAPARNRAADSMAIHAVLSQFWQRLEAGRVGELKQSYPNMPKDWESMWGTFVDYAKDLEINSSIGKIKFTDDEAETTNQVRMTFRDRSGQKTQDVRYSARLVKQSNQWIIEQLEQNR